MNRLADKRPIFHSEADFQHALAWEMQHAWPDADIRLEYRSPDLPGSQYLDIWAIIDGSPIAVELKYKTRSIDVEVDGETFDLRKQSAHPRNRYHFLIDIERLERLAQTRPSVRGFAIFLTNDQGYWSEGRGDGPIDADFRIHEGQSLTGELSWAERASGGTTSGLEDPIVLDGSYPMAWLDYSTVGETQGEGFRYVPLEIG